MSSGESQGPLGSQPVHGPISRSITQQHSSKTNLTHCVTKKSVGEKNRVWVSVRVELYVYLLGLGAPLSVSLGTLTSCDLLQSSPSMAKRLSLGCELFVSIRISI